MKKYHYFILLLIAQLFIHCKSARTISSGDADYSLSTKQVIRENAKQTAEFKTMASRVKINIIDGNKEKSYTVNLRIEKDKQILLSSTPISVVKALISPEKVSFYNKLDNTYFEGDYSYLSNLLGTKLDFTKVQNLLLGEALYNLKEGSFKSSIHEKEYLLEPRRQLDFFEVFYLLNPSHFKVTSQQFSQAEQHRHLQIDYLKHQEVGKQILPEQLKVIAVEGTNEIIINLEFKNMDLNEDLNFAFRIPSGYKEIELE